MRVCYNDGAEKYLIFRSPFPFQSKNHREGRFINQKTFFFVILFFYEGYTR